MCGVMELLQTRDLSLSEAGGTFIILLEAEATRCLVLYTRGMWSLMG